MRHMDLLYTLVPYLFMPRKKKIIFHFGQSCECVCEFWQIAHAKTHTCVCVCDWNFGKTHTCMRCACGRKPSVRMCVRARQKIVATHRLLNVIHTLEPGWQMMDSFGLWSTQINEIFRISFFLTGSLNDRVRFLFSSFFGHQGIHIWP